MRFDHVKLQLAAFVILSGGVGANIFLLQSHALERFANSISSRKPATQVAQAAREFIGATGSIGLAEVVSTEEAPRAPANPPAAQPQDGTSVTRAVQRELLARGYDTGATDGVVGVMTRASIVGFEFDHGLALTGQPSDELLKGILLGGDGKSEE